MRKFVVFLFGIFCVSITSQAGDRVAELKNEGKSIGIADGDICQIHDDENYGSLQVCLKSFRVASATSGLHRSENSFCKTSLTINQDGKVKKSKVDKYFGTFLLKDHCRDTSYKLEFYPPRDPSGNRVRAKKVQVDLVYLVNDYPISQRQYMDIYVSLEDRFQAGADEIELLKQSPVVISKVWDMWLER